MDALEYLYGSLEEIEGAIGYTFKDKNLLALSFIHCSYINENRSTEEHNERLEFLGDAVLGLLAAEYLYEHYPSIPEGELSFMRSRLVDAHACIQYVERLQLDRYLLLGRGERLNPGKGRLSIIADFFEALIGAIYLDGGLEVARSFLFANFGTAIDQILEQPWQNWKALLQDFCQKQHHATPTYEVLTVSGPDHSKSFSVAVSAAGEVLAEGVGFSKKEAQQDAAREACIKLQIEKSEGVL